MFLLHQSAYIKLYDKKKIAPEGFEPSYIMMKTLCLKPLDYKAFYNNEIYFYKFIIYIYIYIIYEPSASIALASAGYKTATLLLC